MIERLQSRGYLAHAQAEVALTKNKNIQAQLTKTTSQSQRKIRWGKKIRKQKAGAAVITTATPNATNINMINDTTRHIAESNPKLCTENFSEQIAELLFYLQNPLSREEQTRGWQVFEQSLRHYVSVKNIGEGGNDDGK